MSCLRLLALNSLFACVVLIPGQTQGDGRDALSEALRCPEEGICSDGLYAYTSVSVLNPTDVDAVVTLYWLKGGSRLARQFLVPAKGTFQARRLPPGPYYCEVSTRDTPARTASGYFNVTIYDTARRLFVFHSIITLRDRGATLSFDRSADFFYRPAVSAAP